MDKALGQEQSRALVGQLRLLKTHEHEPAVGQAPAVLMQRLARDLCNMKVASLPGTIGMAVPSMMHAGDNFQAPHACISETCFRVQKCNELDAQPC